MKTIGCLSDLKAHGIYPLTGEACGLMMRVLCDFSETGRRAIGKWLGIPEFQGAAPWNSQTGEEKHVGSILLEHDAYLSLGVFCLLEGGCAEVFRLCPASKDSPPVGIISDRSLYGFGPEENESRTAWLDRAVSSGWSCRRFACSGTAGDRNVHVMSGRVT
jgi:hypothetical protein